MRKIRIMCIILVFTSMIFADEDPFIKDCWKKFNAGQKNEAISAVKKALVTNPKSIQYHDMLASFYSIMGKSINALAEYETILRIDPKFGAAYIGIAIIYHKQAQYQSGIKSLDKGIALGGKVIPEIARLFIPYRLEYAKYKISEGKYWKTKNSAASSHWVQGNWALKKANFDEALEKYKKALLIEPNHRDAILNVGLILFNEKKDYRGAIEWFKKGLVYYPYFPKYLNNTGVCYYRQGEYKRAIKYLDDAMRWGYAVSMNILDELKAHR